jgi:hypothetical protein
VVLERTEMISWVDRARKVVVFGPRFKEHRSILQRVQRRKGNWFDHILYRSYREG